MVVLVVVVVEEEEDRVCQTRTDGEEQVCMRGLGVGAFPPLNSRMLGGGCPRGPVPFGGRHA